LTPEVKNSGSGFNDHLSSMFRSYPVTKVNVFISVAVTSIEEKPHVSSHGKASSGYCRNNLRPKSNIGDFGDLNSLVKMLKGEGWPSSPFIFLREDSKVVNCGAVLLQLKVANKPDRIPLQPLEKGTEPIP
jgi:hypothetical protein